RYQGTHGGRVGNAEVFIRVVPGGETPGEATSEKARLHLQCSPGRVWLSALMDYAFAPGVSDYDGYMRKFLTYRTDTKLIQVKGLTTVAGFFNRPNTQPAAQMPKPVGDLLIASHGNDLGWMQIDLIGGGAKHTDFAELTRIMNTPAASAAIKLPDALY